MGRPYLGPKLWLDERRGTWTIVDGRKRVRTGCAQHERDQAVIVIHQYSNGNYNPERPRGPTPIYKVPPRKGVYVVGFGPYVKIGITTNLEMRLSGLQTPEPVKVYALIEQGQQLAERFLHGHFAEYRLQGEWFKKEGDLAVWIDGGCQMLGDSPLPPASPPATGNLVGDKQ